MRGRFDDAILEKVAINGLKLVASQLTLGGNLTLTDDYPSVLELDAGGSSRNVTFPARALANDGIVRIVVNHSTAGENLVLKDSDGTTRITLGVGQVGLALAINTEEALSTRAWKMYVLGGDDLAISDNLTVTGALTGSSATFSSSVTVSGYAKLNGSVGLGDSVADVVGFYGSIGVSQPSGASQQAFSTNAPVSISATQWGFTSSNQVQSILNFLVEARSALVRTGFIKGDA